MKRALTGFFIGMALTLMSPAFGGVAGWSEYAAISELTPTSQERYQFRLELAKNPSGCKNADTFFQDYSDNGSDRMYNLLLQALLYGKKVRVHVTGVCEIDGFSEISAVSLAP